MTRDLRLTLWIKDKEGVFVLQEHTSLTDIAQSRSPLE